MKEVQDNLKTKSVVIFYDFGTETKIDNYKELEEKL